MSKQRQQESKGSSTAKVLADDADNDRQDRFGKVEEEVEEEEGNEEHESAGEERGHLGRRASTSSETRARD